MRAFVHLFLGGGRLVDEIGADYPDLRAARDDAVKSAREFFADELRRGRPVSADAFIEILDKARAIIDYVPSEEILFARPARGIAASMTPCLTLICCSPPTSSSSRPIALISAPPTGSAAPIPSRGSTGTTI